MECRDFQEPGSSVYTTGKKFKRRLDYCIEYLQRQKMLDIKGHFDVPDKNIKKENLSNTKSNKAWNSNFNCGLNKFMITYY